MVANFITSYKVLYSPNGKDWRYYTLDGASAAKVIDL